MVLPAEFSLIARHFRPLAGPGALDLSDDAALLTPPPGRELVLTADAMVAGVHFLPDDPPDLIGRKLLRVNLSDLAAKGAVPLGYLMTVSDAEGHPGGLVRKLRGRTGARPGNLRRDAAGRRHDLDPRPDFAVADDHRASRARAPRCIAPALSPAMRSGSPARSATGPWAWRWRRPACRPDRVPAGSLPPAPAASRV